VSTRLILSASALLLGILGIAGTFAPHEILAALGADARGVVPILVQLLAAALFGFAMINWLARGSLIGGIYNRPVAVGNVAHFVIGALALVKFAAGGAQTTALYVLAAIYAVFAVLFAMLLFRSPVTSDATS
jgi:hypothetical protein